MSIFLPNELRCNVLVKCHIYSGFGFLLMLTTTILIITDIYALTSYFFLIQGQMHMVLDIWLTAYVTDLMQTLFAQPNL
jgi:hypothetical protein